MTEGLWKGRPLEDMTKEELIQAVVGLDAFWQRRLKAETRTAEVSDFMTSALKGGMRCICEDCRRPTHPTSDEGCTNP